MFVNSRCSSDITIFFPFWVAARILVNVQKEKKMFYNELTPEKTSSDSFRTSVTHLHVDYPRDSGRRSSAVILVPFSKKTVHGFSIVVPRVCFLVPTTWRTICRRFSNAYVLPRGQTEPGTSLQHNLGMTRSCLDGRKIGDEKRRGTIVRNG